MLFQSDTSAPPLCPTSVHQKPASFYTWEAVPHTLLVLVFVLAGLIGHDPWKADEAYIFGVIQHMLESSDWVVPTLAGEPFMEKPPLFYWVAVACASLFSGWLPLHDGARLASGIFMLITCWAVGSTARIWWGEDNGRYAILVIVACLGTLVQSHLMMPDVPLLTGFALSALGFAAVLGRSVAGGLLLGLGVGIGFLAKGVIAPAVIGMTALLLPACFQQWHTRAYWRGLAIACLVSAPCLLIWPAVLYTRSPALFMEWFWLNNIGRFLGFSVDQLGAEHLPWFWTQTLPWFTFPGLPLALWSLWKQRKTALSNPPVQYALVAFGVLMLVLAMSSSARCVYAWPLMIPIAILAAPVARSLPRQVDQLWGWASLALFGVLSLFIWVGWMIMMLKGAPPNWPNVLRVLPSEFVPHFDVFSTIAAMLVTLGSLLVLPVLWNKPARGLTTWVIGVTLSWSLLMTLWLPWLDFAKSYRSVFDSLPQPAISDCLASKGLGEGERAMLRYVTGIISARVEVSPNTSCTHLLVQGNVTAGVQGVDGTVWQELWQGARPGDTQERFWLFQRAASVSPEQGH